MNKFGLTPEQYRKKWDLDPTYPMVAPNYAARRSELAKTMGLGERQVGPVNVAIAVRSNLLNSSTMDCRHCGGKTFDVS